MNTGLWIIQILLALMFLFHGRLLLFPSASLQSGMTYIMAIPTGFRRLIGIAEILAGIGLVLPALSGILPWLTGWAALGLALIMLLAALYHLLRREYPNILFNLVLLALAVFVAYGRFVVLPL